MYAQPAMADSSTVIIGDDARFIDGSLLRCLGITGLYKVRG
jgi:hypothetical protein